jgi:hypothetical protein
MRGWRAVAVVVAGTSCACTLEQHVGFQDPPPETTAADAADFGGDEDTGGDDDGDMKLDVETAECRAPDPVSCDALDDGAMHALGINCPGGVLAKGGYSGAPNGMIVVDGLGTSGVFEPQEGEKFLVLSTGVAEEILLTPEEIADGDKEQPGSCTEPTNCPSTSMPGWDFHELVPPIDVRPVHDPEGSLLPEGEPQQPLDCNDLPGLVGTGDCSNTLWEQWDAAGSPCLPDQPSCSIAHDYTELRVQAIVPEGATGVSFDFAFGTIEYPNFWHSAFNDMFVAWLESEEWTGNVSFDETGHPISLNAVFLEYKDAIPPDGCPGLDCDAPQLDGFALEGHAATHWLNSTAGVNEGETIELVFAVFDLSDGYWDSYVMLDGFRWTCTDQPPVTQQIP